MTSKCVIDAQCLAQTGKRWGHLSHYPGKKMRHLTSKCVIDAISRPVLNTVINTKQGNSTLRKSLPPTSKYLLQHMVTAHCQALLHVYVRSSG